MLSHPKQLRLSTQLRLAGFGFKAASRPGHASTHGRRRRRLLIMRLCGILPSTLWLSVSLGRWIRPEIVGAIVDRLQDHFLHNCLLRSSMFQAVYPSMKIMSSYILQQFMLVFVYTFPNFWIKWLLLYMFHLICLCYGRLYDREVLVIVMINKRTRLELTFVRMHISCWRSFQF